MPPAPHPRLSPLTGALGGAVFAGIALIALALWLAQGDGNVVKALVPIWLTFLPLIGAGALAGWLGGATLLALRRQRANRAEAK